MLRIYHIVIYGIGDLQLQVVVTGPYEFIGINPAGICIGKHIPVLGLARSGIVSKRIDAGIHYFLRRLDTLFQIH